MNLEEMLRQEMERHARNPLIDRTDEIVSRVRHRRRARAAAAGVVSVVILAVVAVVAGPFLSAEVSPPGIPPAERPASEPTSIDAVSLSQVPADSPLAPGRYVASVAGEPAAPLLPVLSVPAGYLSIGTGVGTDDLERYLWVWDVDSVFAHPCDASAEPVGPSVADLANALAAQPLRAGTDPVPVTVGGYDGLYVELSVPDVVDDRACTDSDFSLWPERGQSDVQEILGQVDMVWIVDVDGQRITFDAAFMPTTSPAEVAELKAMVTTATFTPAESS